MEPVVEEDMEVAKEVDEKADEKTELLKVWKMAVEEPEKEGQDATGKPRGEAVEIEKVVEGDEAEAEEQEVADVAVHEVGAQAEAKAKLEAEENEEEVEEEGDAAGAVAHDAE